MLPLVHPAQGPAHNPDSLQFPDRLPCGSQAGAQSTEPNQPGHHPRMLWRRIVKTFNGYIIWFYPNKNKDSGSEKTPIIYLESIVM